MVLSLLRIMPDKIVKVPTLLLLVLKLEDIHKGIMLLLLVIKQVNRVKVQVQSQLEFLLEVMVLQGKD